MSYDVFILRRAQKALSKIHRQDRERIQEAVHALAKEPRPPGCRKLSGREGWRVRVGQYRVGQYRVVYEIDDAKEEATVLDVGHRWGVYR